MLLYCLLTVVVFIFNEYLLGIESIGNHASKDKRFCSISVRGFVRIRTIVYNISVQGYDRYDADMRCLAPNSEQCCHEFQKYVGFVWLWQVVAVAVEILGI